jgi:hypothetical protein
MTANLELEKNVVMDYFHVISHHLSGRTEADNENLIEVNPGQDSKKEHLKHEARILITELLRSVCCAQN